MRAVNENEAPASLLLQHGLSHPAAWKRSIREKMREVTQLVRSPVLRYSTMTYMDVCCTCSTSRIIMRTCDQTQ